MSDNKYNLSIPEMKFATDYLEFKKEVLLWESITSIPEESRGGNLVFKLPKKAKSVALEMSREELSKGVTVTVDGVEQKTSGVQRLLEVLDGVYLDDLHKEKFKAYDEFRSFKRQSDQSINDFLIYYDLKKKCLESHGIKLPEEIYAFELLASCNLTENQKSLANTTVQNLTYASMKDQIKKVVTNTSNKNESIQQNMMKVKEETEFFANERSNPECNESCQEPDYQSNNEVYPEEDDSAYYTNRGQYQYRQRKFNGNGRNTRGSSGRQLNNQSRSFNSRYQNTNSKDQYGNVLKCFNCNSIYHLARDCTRNAQYFSSNTEQISLFQNKFNPPKDSLDQFTGDNFCLAVLDSGCNTTVCGREWLNVYLESLDEDDKTKVRKIESKARFKFGDNNPTVSLEKYFLPALVCNKKITIATQVVKDNIPLLISKRSMTDAKMILNFGENTVTAFGYTQKLLFTESGHCSIPLKKISVHDDICLCSRDNIILTVLEESNKKLVATKLHKQFGHPRAAALKSLLKQAGKDDKLLFKEIDNLSNTCVTCLRYKIPESRPIVSMPLATSFNETVSMDLKIYEFVDGIYFQHMIDHSTRFSMAKVIKSKDKETLIESIFTHWISIFGRPKRFMSDNGGEYNNHNFVDMCEKLGVHIITTGAEAAWSNGLVERHHALISRNVKKIIEDTGCRVETALGWAINAKNCLSNTEVGFSPYQLVLGMNPQLPCLDDPNESPTILSDLSPSEKVVEHLKALFSARKHQVEKDADERIRRALSHRTRDVKSKVINNGDKVFYKRDNSDRWKGPATVIGIDGKVVFLRQGGFQIKCHICRVVNVNDIFNKHDESDNTDPQEPLSEDSNFNEARNFISYPESSVETNSPRKATNEEHLTNSKTASGQEPVQNDPMKIQKLLDVKSQKEKKKLTIRIPRTDPFAEEKLQELEKWSKNDVFEEIEVDKIENLNEINLISVGWNYVNTEKKRKARLVARGYLDEPLSPTEITSPTCRKESLRILFSICVAKNWTVKSVDITSAFLQGKAIERTVYLIPPKEYNKNGILWKLKKCVYGLSDAAKIWYESVKDRIEESGIQKCPHDDAFFYWNLNGEIKGLVSIHVDDFIFCGDSDFESKLQEYVLETFNVGSKHESEFTYLGWDVSQSVKGDITISQHDYISKDLSTLPLTDKRKSQHNYALSNDEFKAYKSQVGKLQWLSIQTRPDISFEVCQLSNHLSDPTVKDIISLNKVVSKLKNDPEIKLSFKMIEFENVLLKVYTDSAYGNLPGHGSQCGYIIFLTDKNEQVTNPVAWKSVKIERVCQSALAAEGLGLVKAIDHAIFIQQTLKKILICENNIPIHCFTDNKSLFEILQKTKDPEEKKLICILAPIRSSIETGEINLFRITSKEMPADVLTKKGVNTQVLRSHLES